MTAKRYHKLFRAEMTKLMAGKPGAAACIKSAASATPRRQDGTQIPYAEAWNRVRTCFCYGDNVPPVK